METNNKTSQEILPESERLTPIEILDLINTHHPMGMKILGYKDALNASENRVRDLEDTLNEVKEQKRRAEEGMVKYYNLYAEANKEIQRLNQLVKKAAKQFGFSEYLQKMCWIEELAEEHFNKDFENWSRKNNINI